MAELLRMPAVAANADKALLLAWSVAESAAYTAEDTLAEVETDKAVVDIEAESDGVLLRTLVAAGTEVAVGTPIALLGVAGDRHTDLDALLGELGVDAATLNPADTPASTVVRREVPDAPDEHAAAAVGETLDHPDHADGESADLAPALVAADTSPGVDGSAAPDTEDRGGRIFASPLARRLALQAGIPLTELTGTGPHGRIRRVDVEGAVGRQPAPGTPVAAVDRSAQAVPAAAISTSPPAGDDPTTSDIPWTDEPHSRLRAVVARRLTESKATVPHFYLRASVRVDRLLALRTELNEIGDVRLSVNDLVVKAVARAHTAVPEMNAIWTPDAVRRFHHVDVAVAVASSRGLVTPTLRAVETLSVQAISTQVKDMVERANAGKLRPEELQGGAVTVTNLGMYGVQEFLAIINPPQSAILAVGAARPEPVVVDGRVEVATVMHLTVSVDHRVSDGAVAARWLAALVDTLERPLSVLT